MVELVGVTKSHSFCRLVTKPNTRLHSLVHVDIYLHDQEISVNPPTLHKQHLEHSRNIYTYYIYT